MERVVRAPWVRWRRIGDRMYLYDDKARKVHVLNSLAAEIWVRLESPTDPYDVALAVTRENPQSVVDFIEELVGLGCVVRA